VLQSCEPRAFCALLSSGPWFCARVFYALRSCEAQSSELRFAALAFCGLRSSGLWFCALRSCALLFYALLFYALLFYAVFPVFSVFPADGLLA
jgi:hypothetical protein